MDTIKIEVEMFFTKQLAYQTIYRCGQINVCHLGLQLQWLSSSDLTLT